jgi:hypothetical protein
MVPEPAINGINGIEEMVESGVRMVVISSIDRGSRRDTTS